MATISCPQCSERLELPDAAAGNPLRCPQCQHLFASPTHTGVASGEPPARSEADAAVTEHAPRPGRTWDEPDFPQPRRRRDIVKKSSPALLILIVVGVAVIGLFAFGIPMFLFLGFISLAPAERHQVEVVARVENQPAVAAGKAVEEQAPNLPVQRNPVAEAAIKIQFDPDKEAYVTIECWENGKPSKRFAKVKRRLIQPNGEVAIEVTECPGLNKTICEIAIGDGLGLSPIPFELPGNLKIVVSPLPAEIAVKNGAPTRFCFVCVDKNAALRPNETAEELARRVEYAFVLSLGEAEKN